MHNPNPTLDEKEKELLDSSPEDCFRHAFQRGALSLDQVYKDLSPRLVAVLKSIAAGERLEAQQESDAAGSQTSFLTHESAQKMLSHHPQLTLLLNDRTLTPDEALETAHAIDALLGRYTTGTRYAAP